MTCYHRTYEDDDRADEHLIQDFDAFHTHFYDLIHEDVWKEYYSPEFLAQPSSANFYRQPNLQDLTYTHSPLGKPRDVRRGHYTKLPRWAVCVACTRFKQRTLAPSLLYKIALSTLQQSIEAQRNKNPQIRPYSETQARFWLNRFKIDSEPDPQHEDRAWGSMQLEFGLEVARGHFEIWEWEKWYSPDTWESSSSEFIEPDLDGSKKSDYYGTGWPDGGTGVYAAYRGWQPELGSLEEIAFLAEVAVKETEGVGTSMLDYSVRSHILLAVLHVAFSTQQDALIGDLKQRVVSAGRINNEERAEQWIRQALEIIQPYTAEQLDWPTSEANRSGLLRRILLDNGQLFSRWGWQFGTRGPPKACIFELESRK